MRKVFIDENLSPLISKPLSAIYRTDRFLTSAGLKLSGMHDLEHFPTLSQFDVGMLVTKDRAQLEDDVERAGLAKAGLHWLGVPEISERGTFLIAQQLAVAVPAVGLVLQDWPTVPTAFTLGQPGGATNPTPVRRHPRTDSSRADVPPRRRCR